MKWLDQIQRRLAVLLRRERFDRDLEEEMQAHLEMQAEENVENGMPPEEARNAARRQFGNPTLLKEKTTDIWGWRWFEELARDVRYSLRALRNNPGWSFVIILTLALGIGSNTAVFSLLEAVLLRPLPYHEPERLVMVATVEAESQRAMNSSYPDYLDWCEQNRTFENLAAFRGGSFNLTGKPEPERVRALLVTPNLFQLLGISPTLGRDFFSEDDQQVVLLTHRIWMRRFGGNPDIIGAPIHLDGQAYIVLGVLPRGFQFPPERFSLEPEIFVPMAPYADRTNWSLRVIGRLKSEVSEQVAQADLNVVAARLAEAYPSRNGRQGVQIFSLRSYVGSGVRQTTLVLLGAVVFVLLIACANVANLLLSRGAARRREIGIRVTIGASRARVTRQLLTEALVLAFLGGALGVVLAQWGLPLLTALAPERTAFFTRIRDAGIKLNWAVLAFTLAISAFAGILFGVLSAWKSTQPIGSSVRSMSGNRLRGALVTAEVALSFVLLCGAGLMMKSLVQLLSVDLGFQTAGLLTMEATLPEAKYPEAAGQIEFFRRVLQRLEDLPGVVSASAIADLPLTRAYSVNTIGLEGEPPRQGRALQHQVSTGYFNTMGIPLLHGRLFSDSDTEETSGVVAVNRSMAESYWPQEDPIGKAVIASRGIVEETPEGRHLRFEKQRLEIVGVVGNVRHIAIDAAPRPELFFPHSQRPSREMTLILRTAADPASLIPAAKEEIWRIDPDQPVTNIKTMDEWISLDIAPRRFVLLLIGSFALLAVTLAACGIYGVISYSVEQRTQEIGVRMALGAQRGNLLWLAIRQNTLWLAVGIAIGTAGAVVLTRLLDRYLYEVTPTDPATFVLVGLTLAAVALAANAIPARRVSRIDPMEALRYE